MKTIWKFEIPLRQHDIVLDVPADCEVVRFAMQNGVPKIWALVTPTAATVARTFKVVGTGQKFEDDAAYLGSIEDGPFVWHLLQRHARSV